MGRPMRRPSAEPMQIRCVILRIAASLVHLAVNR
jgi:hypothetical protein